MRKLLWFVIGFAAGIALCYWLTGNLWYFILAGLGIAGFIILKLLDSPAVFRNILLTVCIGCAVGIAWLELYGMVWLKPAMAYHGQSLETSVVVTDYSRESSNGISADGLILINQRRYKVRLYLNDTEALKPGDRLDGQFEMRYTGNTGVQSGSRYQAEGIHFLAYANNSPYVYRTAHGSQKYVVANLRNRLYTLISDLFPEDTQGFARALLLGDSSDLSDALDNAFRNSGIRHIIAVSGLHVSILFAGIYQMVGKRRWMTAIFGLPALFFFAALAGFTPSVVRACVMQALMIFSILLRKEYDPPTALAFAALVILGVNPAAINSVSFQLSVASVAGIFLFAGKIHAYIISRKWMGKVSGKSISSKIKRWFSSSVSVSLSAISLTTPLSAYYFGTVSIVGVLTNLLTLWCVTCIFCGIMIACLAGGLFAPAGWLIAQIVSVPMRYVQSVAKLIGSIPYATVSAKDVYVVCWLVFTYLLIFLFLVSKKKKPVLLLGCIIAGLCSALLLSWNEHRQCDYQMSVLDVGQGQCIVLQSGDACYVVDCGGDVGSSAATLVVSTLRTQGIFEIDGLILTHFDVDHMGGAASLLSQMPVASVYIPDADGQLRQRMELEEAYAHKINVVRNNAYFSCGDAYISIFPANLGTDGNNSSLSILFQAENCDILITGDLNASGEKRLLETVRLPDIEILVAGHHGAKDSTSKELLDRLKPETVVISVGRDNPYGHPAVETLDKLKLFGCQIWRTDLDGTVIFRG